MHWDLFVLTESFGIGSLEEAFTIQCLGPLLFHFNMPVILGEAMLLQKKTFKDFVQFM